MLSEGWNAVKRLGRLVSARAPRLGLADDRFMGQVKIVTPHSPLSSLAAFFGNHGSGKLIPITYPWGAGPSGDLLPCRLEPEIDTPRGTGNPDCAGASPPGLRRRAYQVAFPSVTVVLQTFFETSGPGCGKITGWLFSA